MIGKATVDELDVHTQKLNSFLKVVLSTKGGFKDLDILNYSSLSQIQGGMDEGKKGKRNVCQVTVNISRRKFKRGELVIGPLKPKKLKKAKKKKLHIWRVG